MRASGDPQVLQVNTYHHLRGGDSRCMFETAGQLRARGITVRHFAMQHERNVSDPEAEDFAPNVDYPELMREGGIASKLRVLGASIHNNAARAALRRVLDRERPTVAHLHSIMHHLTASVVLELRERRIPIVWTLHDYKSVCPTTHLRRDGHPCDACANGRFFEATRHRCKRGHLGASLITTIELHLHRHWRIYEDADLLLAPSRFLRDKVLEMGLRPRRIEILPNFVDVREFETAGEDRGYVLFVGRLSHEKGLPTLIESVTAAGTDLRIVGTGELDEEVRTILRDRGLHNVRLEGFRTGEELRDLYRGARAVVIPSECYENCPMVVLEAYAYGKPVIGSSLGGLMDLVRPDETGILVPPGDVSAWATALASVDRDPARWQRMGRRAREVAAAQYDAKPHMDALLGYYEEVSGVSWRVTNSGNSEAAIS